MSAEILFVGTVVLLLAVACFADFWLEEIRAPGAEDLPRVAPVYESPAPKPETEAERAIRVTDARNLYDKLQAEWPTFVGAPEGSSTGPRGDAGESRLTVDQELRLSRFESDRGHS